MTESIKIALIFFAIFATALNLSALEPTPPPKEDQTTGLVCGDGIDNKTYKYDWLQNEFGEYIPPNDAQDENGIWKIPLEICIDVTGKQSAHNGRRPKPVTLPTPSHPDCVPPNFANCPLPISFNPPPGSDNPTPPPPPFPHTSIPKPDATGCVPGTGWDFETVTDQDPFDGWIPFAQGSQWPIFVQGGVDPDDPVGLPGKAKAIFGNNVDIYRFTPPGFTFLANLDPKTQLGGDYWRFARGIGYGGNWWIGTSDYRPRANLQPDGRVPDAGTGVLASPTCILNADYLTFRIGGTSSDRQYVVFAVYNPGGEPLHYEGIGTVEFPPVALPPTDLPSNIGLPSDWTIVFKSAVLNKSDRDFMGRQVVWRVKPFIGREVRILLVDDRSQDPCLGNSCFAHINADEFLYTDEAPEDTVWFKKKSKGFRTVVTNVGTVDLMQDLWGLTDAHAHPVANMSFGKHLIWGDVADNLQNVYNCNEPLPNLTDQNGIVVRPASQTVDGSPMIQTDCFVNVDILLAVTPFAFAACIGLGSIPFVGPGLMAECQLTVIDTAQQLAQHPIFTAVNMHGATEMSSGEVIFGEWLQALTDADGLLRFAGAIPTLDWDSRTENSSTGENDHSGLGLGGTHQAYQKEMIERAYLGGVRLMVMDVVNNRTLQLPLDGDHQNDWQALEEGIASIHRLVAVNPNIGYIGPLAHFARIVFSPEEARTWISRGRMAIILGAEVPGLGFQRPEDAGQDPSVYLVNQVQKLWDLGIRKITPIHGVNNPLGGTAYFNAIYNTANFYEGGQTTTPPGNFTGWAPLELDGNMEFFLSVAFPPPFSGVVLLGEWEPADIWENGQWFPLDPTNPANVNLPYAGPIADLTFRHFYTSAKKQLALVNPSISSSDLPFPEDDCEYGDGFGLPLVPIELDDFGFLIGDPGPNDVCNLEGTLLPLENDRPDMCAYAGQTDPDLGNGIHFHFNPTGLTAEGEIFLRAAMKRGMLIGLDHLSARARDQALALGEQYAAEAGVIFGSGAYPFFSEHTQIRGWDQLGPVPDVQDVRNKYGYNNESQRTESEIAYIGSHGGMIAPTVRSGGIVPPELWASDGQNTIFGDSVRNDCDYSSKSWAVRYLKVIDLTDGRGITPSTDFNPNNAFAASRFGWAGPRSRACHVLADTADLYAAALGLPSQWNRDFHPVTASGCTLNSLGTWSASCPSTQMVVGQFLEFSGVWYEEYSLKNPVAPSNVPPGLFSVAARNVNEIREDQAARAAMDEWVNYNTNGTSSRRIWQQMFSMKQFNNFDGNVANDNRIMRGWDFNLDGFAHIGMYPDFVQDVRNTGVTFEQLGPLFNSPEDLVDTWTEAIAIGNAHP